MQAKLAIGLQDKLAMGTISSLFSVVNAMKEFLHRLLLDEDGPTAVEYAVMLAMIITVCVGSVRIFGAATADSLDNSATEIANAFK